MKVEHLFPALLSAVYLFLYGAERPSSRVRTFVTGAVVLLLAAYVVDVGVLLQRLA